MTEEILSFLDRKVREFRAFASIEFDLPNLQIPYEYSFSKYRLKSKTKFRNHQPYLYFGLFKYTQPCAGFSEYSHFANDPEIGTVLTSDWKSCLLLCIAHEVAHLIHCEFLFSKQSSDVSHHGEDFQKIYRVLRKQINSELVILKPEVSFQEAVKIAYYDKDFETKYKNVLVKSINGNVYRVYGYRHRNYKYPVILTDVKTGEAIKISEADFALGVKRFQKEGY